MRFQYFAPRSKFCYNRARIHTQISCIVQSGSPQNNMHASRAHEHIYYLWDGIRDHMPNSATYVSHCQKAQTTYDTESLYHAFLRLFHQ